MVGHVVVEGCVDATDGAHAAVLHEEFPSNVDLAKPADLEKRCRIHEGIYVHCDHVAWKVDAHASSGWEAGQESRDGFAGCGEVVGLLANWAIQDSAAAPSHCCRRGRVL